MISNSNSGNVLGAEISDARARIALPVDQSNDRLMEFCRRTVRTVRGVANLLVCFGIGRYIGMKILRERMR